MASPSHYRARWEKLPKRSRYLVLGATLLVVWWLGLTLIVDPRVRERENLRREVSSMEQAVTALRAEVMAVSRQAAGEGELSRSLEELNRRLDEAAARLPRGRALSSFLRDLTAPRRGEEIVFLSITPQPLENRGEFLELPFVIELKASYRALAAYLERVETMERLVVVRNISLRSETDAAELRITLSAATFLLGEG